MIDAEPLCRYCRNRDGRIVPATILDDLIALSIAGSNDAKAADEMRFIARGYDAWDFALDPAFGEWVRLALPASTLNGRTTSKAHSQL